VPGMGMIEMNGRSREHEFIGKFYINGYGVIGLILDYDDYEKCSWLTSEHIGRNQQVDSENMSEIDED